MTFAAALTDPSFAGRDHLYMDNIRADPFGGRPGWTVRDADWKLIEFDDGGKELYDLRSDLAESDDLISDGVPADLTKVVNDLETYGTALRESRG